MLEHFTLIINEPQMFLIKGQQNIKFFNFSLFNSLIERRIEYLNDGEKRQEKKIAKGKWVAQPRIISNNFE